MASQKQKKNFSIQPDVLKDLYACVERLKSLGAQMKPGQIVDASIVMFLALPVSEQLTWIEKGRNYDIATVRAAQGATLEAAADLDQVVSVSPKPGGRKQASRSASRGSVV